MTEPAEDGRRRNSRPPLADIGAATMIAALVLTPWIPAILRGAMPHFMDTVTQFFPYRRLVGVLLAGGDAPFWNPSMFGGVPLLANPQVGALYPGHIPFFVYPTGGMFTLTLAFHVSLASAGMYGLLRRLGCSGAAACFGALALGWNGWAWAHFAFGSYHQVWAWWPWLWWFALAWTERGGKGWRVASVGVAVLMTLQALAGAPQMVFYSALALALLMAAGWFFGPRPRRNSFGPLLAGVGLAALLATGWSLPQLLPTRAYFEECLRTEALPVEEVRGGALSAADLARSFLGGAGSPEDAESTAYFGALWLALAGIGLVARRSRKENIVFGLVVLLGALLSWRPLCGVWSAILPGFSHMHDPRRALALCATAIPILAAFGLDRLADSSIPHSAAGRRWIGFGGLFAACAILGRFGIRAVAAEPYADSRALPAAMGWLGPWAFWSEWKLAIATAFAVAVAAGIVWIPRMKSFAESRRAWAVVVLGVWGACSLLIFAVNRVDLKVVTPAAPGGLLDQARQTRERLNRLSAESRKGGDDVPLRVYAFDPTGHYSYDYARPDAGRWLLPNVAALTWDGGDAPLGLRDAQGYDPALPRRMAALMAAVNEGHMQLYPRHFALVRAPRGPLAPRLGARAAIGPANVYVVPLLPPRLEPGQERIAPIEEPAGYARLRLAVVAAAMSEVEKALRIDAALLDAGRQVVCRRSFEFTRDSVAGRSGWMEKTETLDGDVSRAVALALRLGGPAEGEGKGSADQSPVSALAALEGVALSPGFAPLDAAPFALDSPAPFGLAEASPYLQLTDDVRLVPLGEEARSIARMLSRSPATTVLEWPADAPEPPAGGAPRRNTTRETPSPDATDATGAPEAAGEVRLVSWRPGVVEAEARVVAEKSAALVIREPFFAGWSVTVDGEARETVPADIAFQAVWLGPGTHAVRWTYRPPGFRMGLLAAAMATLLAVALVIGERMKEKRVAETPRRESDESES